MNIVKIKTEYIKLDSALKYAGVVMTGGEAKSIIEANVVKVNGEICNIRGKKLKPGDMIEIYGEKYLIK